MLRRLVAGLACLLALGAPGVAQDLTALARVDVVRSSIADAGGGVAVTLGLSQPVPWRVRLLADPPRMVVDTREVDWRGISGLPRRPGIAALRAGPIRPGWSRLVMELDRPLAIARAGMVTGDAPRIEIALVPVDAAAFAARAAQPDPPGWALPDAAALPPPARGGDGKLVVVLDPGHGGIDPGAERDGLTEAGLMLTFARELKEELIRSGGATVVLTRDDDVFVPLEARVSVARAAAADVFLSLHADALAEGNATGATLYTLSSEATDRAAAALAERHDRDDLLAGVDLTGQDDVVAQVLIDMARTETAPRTERAAQALETAIRAEGLAMHRRPRQVGAFSVLKSPDIPSVLLELGFMSSPRDLARLTDADWRARMARAVTAGVVGRGGGGGGRRGPRRGGLRGRAGGG
ncbi:MAG TPA: N-acetylmuramoyl-L-alanine amidase, partial [Paracoccaceae bacterium]|nr:N-acetylmuramoyl-L-alanine amidase [Paracoccaceae bacterium]